MSYRKKGEVEPESAAVEAAKWRIAKLASASWAGVKTAWQWFYDSPISVVVLLLGAGSALIAGMIVLTTASPEEATLGAQRIAADFNVPSPELSCSERPGGWARCVIQGGGNAVELRCSGLECRVDSNARRLLLDMGDHGH